ncbi:hypothetical protein C8J57DRAFT_1020191, partial [Mycena rebaudengoi]
NHVRRLASGHGGHKINVMACTGETAILLVFHFHSTLVMNFISSYGLFCAYPALTLEHTAIPSAAFFDSTIDHQRLEACLMKYTAR